MPQLKNPYGLRDGALLTADTVERGLACRCACPQCGQRLVANHGSGIKQPYFSHESGSECSAAYETALHLLAKEVLGEERRILLPPLRVEVGAVLAHEAGRKKQTLTSRFVVIPAELAAFSITPVQVVAANCYQRFDRVELEGNRSRPGVAGA